LIELREDRETYLVTPDIVLYIEGEFVPAVLYTAINRQGVLSLWPVKLPNSDGRINEWHRTAMVAAEEAMSRWVRVSANMSLGAYEITAATGQLPDPEWPEMPLSEILAVAFRGKLVDNIDHALLQRPQGAA
jgi:hypothetical protein